MITFACLLCGQETDFLGEVRDMVDVVCPCCSVRTRIVAVPLNAEPPDDARCSFDVSSTIHTPARATG